MFSFNQNYADALRARDMSPQKKDKWRNNRNAKLVIKIDKLYENLPAEKALKSLNAHNLRRWKLKDFDDLFQIALADLNSQYLEIRATRKALFQHDMLNDRRCSIDISIPAALDDGPIVWE